MTTPGNTAGGAPDAEVERWFLRRGIPLFIRDYRAATRVWTRAFPFLLVVFAAQCLPLGFTTTARAGLSAVAAVTTVVVAWTLNNLINGQPPFVRPRRVGPLLLVAFVVGPMVGQWIAVGVEAALATAALSLAVLLATYGVVAYGLIPMAVWVVRRLMHSLPELKNAAVRALPLMLMFLTFFMFTAEVWQAMGSLRGLPYVATQLLFAAAGIVFVATRLRGQADTIEQFESWAEVHQLSAGTPAEGIPHPADAHLDADPLDHRERRNVLILLITNQAVMALAVAVVTGAFFLVLGFMTIDAEVVKTWTTKPPDPYFTWSWRSRDLVLTSQHVRVAGFLAAFSGFYFAVYSASDPTVREGLADDGTTQLRQACAVRHVYRHAPHTLQQADQHRSYS